MHRTTLLFTMKISNSNVITVGLKSCRAILHFIVVDYFYQLPETIKLPEQIIARSDQFHTEISFRNQFLFAIYIYYADFFSANVHNRIIHSEYYTFAFI